MFSGELFMVDKVGIPDKDVQTKINLALMVNVKEEISLTKVTITMNENKITVRDSDKQLKDMIRLDQVYPRDQEIKAVLNLESNKGQMRTALEALKIRILDASTLANNLELSYPNFYCMSIINEPS